MLCARCEEPITDEQIEDMVSDINEASQYHRECWLETGKVAWGRDKRGHLYFIGGEECEEMVQPSEE